MELSVLIAERPRFSKEGFDTRRISWVSKDELQEEDHFGKQPFVPKGILHW